jgi:hypothetical protein
MVGVARGSVISIRSTCRAGAIVIALNAFAISNFRRSVDGSKLSVAIELVVRPASVAVEN